MMKNEKEHKIGKYNIDHAKEMNISEGGYINSKISDGVINLNVKNIKEFIEDLESLGDVKSITRNSYAINVQEGEYTNQYLYGYKKINVSAEAGLVLNPRELDIRIFFKHWAAIFYVNEVKEGRRLKSFQIYDVNGTAIHKIFMTKSTNSIAFDSIIKKYTPESNSPFEFKTNKKTENTISTPASFNKEIDHEWRNMKEVHDFYILMNKYKMTRQQLFNCVSTDLAYKTSNDSLHKILSLAKENNEEVTIFISNTGCVQIYTGLVGKVFYTDNWLNLFNKKNKIHILHEYIDECWVVRKPGEYGYVHSLEVFAKNGEQIIQIYGQRNEGEEERSSWRKIINAV